MMQVPLLVNDFLRRAARLYPSKIAVVDGPLRYSYRELQERVNRLSNALLELGIRRTRACTRRLRICLDSRLPALDR